MCAWECGGHFAGVGSGAEGGGLMISVQPFGNMSRTTVNHHLPSSPLHSPTSNNTLSQLYEEEEGQGGGGRANMGSEEEARRMDGISVVLGCDVTMASLFFFFRGGGGMDIKHTHTHLSSPPPCAPLRAPFCDRVCSSHHGQVLYLLHQCGVYLRTKTSMKEEGKGGGKGE